MKNICKKCTDEAVLYLRKKDGYCSNCFITSTIHKFRACIGKNKILHPSSRILIVLCNVPSSLMLLDMVCDGMSLDSKKKLNIHPTCLYVKGLSTNNEINDDDTIRMCKEKGIDVYIVHITQYTDENLKLEVNLPNSINTSVLSLFNKSNVKLSNSDKLEFVNKIKRQLIIRIAKLIDCKIVFTPETLPSLARSLMNNIALGRGSQIEHDVGFSDSRDIDVILIKPMKDISDEEVEHYMKIKGLRNIYSNEDKKLFDSSIQSVIDKFILDLQENSHGTISTICKTADKIGAQKNNDVQRSCISCQSKIVNQSETLTAFEATKVSQLMCVQGKLDIEDIHEVTDNSNLCYSCSRNKALQL